MAQGDPAADLYIVLAGRLRAFVDGQPRRDISRGEVVGELALLSSQPRTATVRAVRDSHLLHLPAQAFHDLVDRQPAVLRSVTHLVVDRLISAERLSRPAQSGR